MYKKIFAIMTVLCLLFTLVSCSSTSTSEAEPEEHHYDDAGFEPYNFWGDSGEWTNGSNYLTFYDDFTFYNDEYGIGGTYDESNDEGNVILYYDYVPEHIAAQGWDETEQYYECFQCCYEDTGNVVLLYPDSVDAYDRVAWTKE